MKEMLEEAKKGHYAVGHFNVLGLPWAKAILTAAEEEHSPVIIASTDAALPWLGGTKTVAGMIRGLVEELRITVPVALHLDHGSYQGCLDSVAAGYSSIMFDGSHLPFEENTQRTKELAELAHQKGLSLEAEVGGIGGTEDGITSQGELADPEECKRICELGVDALAAGIGNIHGVYPADWEGLNLEQLKRIKAAVGDLPLVLHGGTGIPEEQIKAAIREGICKINVNTELNLAFSEATCQYVASGKAQTGKGYDPRPMYQPGTDAIKETVKEKMRLFGCSGRA